MRNADEMRIIADTIKSKTAQSENGVWLGTVTALFQAMDQTLAFIANLSPTSIGHLLSKRGAELLQYGIAFKKRAGHAKGRQICFYEVDE